MPKSKIFGNLPTSEVSSVHQEGLVRIQARKKENTTSLCNPQTNLKQQSPQNINNNQNLQLKRKINSL